MTPGMKAPPPPPISVTPDKPDAYTASAPDFSSDEHADDRVFHINSRWFRYGTNDKGHAAALVLSAILLFAAILIAIIGTIEAFSGKEPKWLEVLVTWIGNAFLFTSGIAVGKSAKSKAD